MKQVMIGIGILFLVALLPVLVHSEAYFYATKDGYIFDYHDRNTGQMVGRFKAHEMFKAAYGAEGEFLLVYSINEGDKLGYVLTDYGVSFTTDFPIDSKEFSERIKEITAYENKLQQELEKKTTEIKYAYVRRDCQIIPTYSSDATPITLREATGGLIKAGECLTVDSYTSPLAVHRDGKLIGYIPLECYDGRYKTIKSFNPKVIIAGSCVEAKIIANKIEMTEREQEELKIKAAKAEREQGEQKIKVPKAEQVRREKAEKEATKEAAREAKELAPGSQERKNVASTLEHKMLMAGSDYYVSTQGKYNEVIKIKYVFVGRPFCTQFVNSDMPGQLKELGFRKVIMTSGFDFTITWNLLIEKWEY